MKYRSSDLFGSTEIDTDTPAWTTHIAAESERQRLEGEVVKAAREWHLSIYQDADALIAMQDSLREAVEALERFEAEQEKR